MQFTAGLVLASLALGVAAEMPGHIKINMPSSVLRSTGATKVTRDVATISGVIAEVGMGLVTLDTAVKAFSPKDQASIEAVAKASSGLTTTITTGTKTIQGTTNITLQDALTLSSQVMGLQTAGNSLVTDLTNAKLAVQEASLCMVVQEQVAGLGTDAQGLIAAIVSKIPDSAQSIANQMASAFTQTLKDTQNTFAAGNCTNGATTLTNVPSNSSAAAGTMKGDASSLHAAGSAVGALAIALLVAVL